MIKHKYRILKKTWQINGMFLKCLIKCAYGQNPENKCDDKES